MGSFLMKVLTSLGFYTLGVFWVLVALLGLSVRSLIGGKKGIMGLFKKVNHDKCPELARKNYQHSFVHTKSGMRFHYVHTGTEDKPLMLCIHGFPDCWYTWKYLLEKFKSDYHVVAVSLRGFGDSDKPDSINEYHIDYLVTDIKEIILALGHDRATLVALDWGGIIAFQVPLFFPEVVDKLVVMNSANYSVWHEFLFRYPIQFLKSWYVFFFQIPFIPEFFMSYNDFNAFSRSFRGEGTMPMRNQSEFFTDEEIEIVKHYAFRNIRYPINYYRALNPLYTGKNLRQVKEKVSQPILVLWGSAFSALDIRMLPYYKDYAEDLQTVVIEGASHWLPFDQPDSVCEEMEKFLAK